MLDGHIVISKFREVNIISAILENFVILHNFGEGVIPLETDLFVHNVKELCKAKGVSVNTAVTESGAGARMMDNVKRGSSPSVEKVQKLAQYFGVTTSQLLGEVAVGSKMDAVALEDLDLIHAFHAADDRTQEIVRLTLKPFGLSALKEKAM